MRHGKSMEMRTKYSPIGGKNIRNLETRVRSRGCKRIGGEMGWVRGTEDEWIGADRKMVIFGAGVMGCHRGGRRKDVPSSSEVLKPLTTGDELGTTGMGQNAMEIVLALGVTLFEANRTHGLPSRRSGSSC